MKKFVTIAVSIILLGTILGCGSTQNASSKSGGAGDQALSTLEKAKKQGYIKVGFANEKPYAYKTKDGKLTGEAVETARYILKKMGIKEMHGVLTKFGSLIAGLKANRFDLITAGMYINPTRGKEVLFADPNYRVGESIAVQTGNPDDLHSYKDIADKGVKVAVMQGGAEIATMKGQGVKQSQIVEVTDQPAAIDSLTAGRVSAITMTGPSLEAMLKSTKSSKIKRVVDFTQPIVDGKPLWNYGGSAFRKSDQEFRDQYTKILNQMKDDGTLYDIINKFGFVKDNLPGDMKAEQLTK